MDGGLLSRDAAAPSLLAISPANPVVNVTIVDGTVSVAPITFKATERGAPVAATWSLDQGALGALDPATGVFQASGGLPGTGTITASFGSSTGATQVTVNISSTRRGGPPVSGQPGPAGYGGVGGEGAGSAADPSLFSGTITPPSSAQDLGFLYPLNGTVWPRGLLAPLLQWQTTHTATAVYIHLSEKGFDFKGYYAFSPSLTGPQLQRQPLDQQAWDQATHGNQGDPLQVDVAIATADGVIGPITEKWTISKAVLQGTVYYASYNSSLNGLASDGSVTGAVLAIQPGAQAPTLAVPSMKGVCHVCHEVSANGSTLFTNNAASDYGYGSSYDLTNGAAPIKAWNTSAVIGLFTYSGLYPDGTFALASVGDYNFHSYGGTTGLFSRDTLATIPSTGFTSAVTNTITPAFSPDGRHVAFASDSHTLSAMDFDCGAPAGSVACAAPPYTFSNLRQIYHDAARIPGWPSFTADGNFVIFQSTITPSTGGSALNTYQGGTAELMMADARQTPKMPPQRLCTLNGFSGDCSTSYLPVVPNHPNDTVYNYEPTVNPLGTGGYSWVVFTTRRAYGNIAQGDPYESNSYSPIDHPITKKLWVAAIDQNPTSGTDPSHPPFYLPGQELNAGDMRGYWVVNPCRGDGASCTTGDECCNGYCRQSSTGSGLVCATVVTGCANEFEKCVTAADCCGASQGYECLNGHCAQPAVIK